MREEFPLSRPAEEVVWHQFGEMPARAPERRGTAARGKVDGWVVVVVVVIVVIVASLSLSSWSRLSSSRSSLWTP